VRDTSPTATTPPECGTKFSPGRFVRRAKNDCLFALTDGTVYFDQGGKRVNLTPTDAASTAVG
jgi:large subunit ribosomal protein L27